MKKLLLPIITCLFIGCSTEEDYMVKSIRQHWEDGAFKENKKIVTLDIKNPRYEIISEKQLQSTVLYHSYRNSNWGRRFWKI